ncbi:hypothetical protein [Prauserella muralis]|uniref:Uncharacterized protein n=1 Tax=Prauserella muralis TaxID=588067 RepID=A0A2V4AR99_9PSEU|nr:hypothetical protein [Prauserella muralis]PXY22564.1 hypothetical protein BAY60_22265 [Prauserella muralis]TWE28255.1 hypothetical protein FHX69_0907 [Prauserella muralis]
MAPVPPTDTELDTLIRARLAVLGIDLDQLPPGTTPDPDTGAPGRDTALASLRAFLRGTVQTLAAYRFDGDDALAQQVAPPQLYPSIATAWTRS